MGGRHLLMGESLGEWYRHHLNDPESDIAFHLPTLVDAVRSIDARTVVELGVRDGASTSALLTGMAGRVGGVISVDIEPTALPPRKGWIFIYGDDMSAAVLAQIPHSIDLLFIDTDHAYAHTLLELEEYGDRVRSGGLILCHDTENEDPAARGEDIGLQPPFPVARALDDYCEMRGYTWTNTPESWGLGTIRVP